MAARQNQQTVLAQHPSVQDLLIEAPGASVNPKKAHMHSLVINSGPLHQPSDSGIKKKQVPKDQTVKVLKYDSNLQAAALCRSDVGKFQVTNTTTNAKSLGGSNPSPNTATAAAAAAKKGPAAPALGGSSSKEATLPPIAGAAVCSGNSVGGKQQQPPPVASGKAHCQVHKRPGSTMTTSVVSVNDAASDAESFSMYSCSCCNVRPSSSRNSNFSEYENMTSVSQRPSNHPSGAGRAPSVTSTKLKTLESELNKERVDRERTQKELELIKQRQNFLLSRLTKEEREKLSALMQQQESA